MIRDQKLRCPALPCTAYLFDIISAADAHLGTVCRKCGARITIVVRDGRIGFTFERVIR